MAIRSVPGMSISAEPTPDAGSLRLAGPQVARERRRRKEQLALSCRLFARFGLDEGAAGHITVLAVYRQHDGMDQTLAAYGSSVIPALNPAGLAQW